MKINSISGTISYVKDLDITAEFYKKLGFREGKRYENSATFYVNWFWIDFVSASAVLANAEESEFHEEARAISRGMGTFIAISVSDVDEFYADIVSKGFKPSSEPRDWDWGRREFVLRDPDGYKLVFFQKIK